MTPAQAELVFSEYSEVLEKNNLYHPERYGPNLKLVNRNELRKSILVWLATQKFEGVDILNRSLSSPDGKRVAVLELAVNLYHGTSLFQISLESIKSGNCKLESREDSLKAAEEWDCFQEKIIKLNSGDSKNYGEILNEILQWECFIEIPQANNLLRNKNTNGKSNQQNILARFIVFFVSIIVIASAIYLARFF